MDWAISAAVIVLAGLINASLQLGIGCLLLLYHSSSQKHIRAKTRSLAGSYVAGIGIMIFVSICTVSFMLLRYYGGALEKIWLLVLVILLAALAFAVWLFYYRWGKGVELWIPKVVARFIDSRARATESNTEAFVLGIMTCFAELPFSLILFVVAGNSILELHAEWQLLAVVLFTLVSMLPLILVRVLVRKGKTITDIQHWRSKHKNFLKILSGAGFLVLGLFILVFYLLN
ncbi:hypothetical protein IJI91_03040 [Candidatus Saccharibacteria bacterium]|nr:hypothetical protein [Candidatus Saccharibacteria bacterium]